MREQTFRHISPLEAPHIVKTLRISGIARFLYALFGGLIPPVPFFPGNLINSDSFERLLGLPTLVFYSLIGLTLTISVIRALEIFEFELEQRIEPMEQQQILSAERERIGRELYDSTIQTAYSAGLLVDSARKLAQPGSQIASHLDHAVVALNDVIHDLRRNLGELQYSPANESLADLLQRLAGDPRYRSMVNVSLDLDITQPDPLTPVRTSHVLTIVSEALSNVVRHANARNVRISANQLDGMLRVVIQDDGIGLSESSGEGFGLRNMQERAWLLGGRLKIESGRGRGTRVLLEAPIKDEH